MAWVEAEAVLTENELNYRQFTLEAIQSSLVYS